ncbi:MAG: DMT family transporter [Methylovirgula sp.]
MALASALFFGASIPIAKVLLGTTDPWMLAGLLYLGSGIGLFFVRIARLASSTDEGEAALQSKDWPWLGGAILAGGVVGPLLLMAGLALTPASTASLMLTLEGVFTALLAWVVFREHFHWRIGLGMAAISIGAGSLAWTGSITLAGLAGPLLLAGACLAWATDNNLTRKISLSDPVQIAMIKGLAAGSTNLVLSVANGASLPSVTIIALSALAGFIGYGISLVLFVVALRHIGTARTGAYFSTAPFVGAVIAILMLGEPITAQIIGAAVLMGVGVWLHLTEEHGHEHKHEPIAHSHRHRHDEHHQHEHDSQDRPGEPHTHWHVHASIRHSHPHYPDAHHRHQH